MQATGIIRRIDDLGRILIPKEIRKQLKIEENDPLEIFLSIDGEIILKPYRQNYILQRSDNREVLADSKGNVIASNNRLTAEEILYALNVEFQIEEVEKN